MHTSLNIKKISKLMSNKRKKEKTHNLPSWIFKIQPFTWHLRHNAKGQLIISYMLAKSFAHKIDSNFREMKINYFILAWINIFLFYKHLEFCLAPQEYLIFSFFFDAFSFLANKDLFFWSHIASYHYYPLVKTHCIKVISTCYVIDIWAHVV
jgi:hypothetical protein